MKVLHSWLREFVDLRKSAVEIARVMSFRGFAVEGIEQIEGGAGLVVRDGGDGPSWDEYRLHVGPRHGARDRHGV
jgi:hypothetical protein